VDSAGCLFPELVSVKGAGWSGCEFLGTVSDVEGAGSADCDFLPAFFDENSRFIDRFIVRGTVSKEVVAMNTLFVWLLVAQALM
jgi:hypothetical protein